MKNPTAEPSFAVGFKVESDQGKVVLTRKDANWSIKDSLNPEFLVRGLKSSAREAEKLHVLAL